GGAGGRGGGGGGGGAWGGGGGHQRWGLADGPCQVAVHDLVTAELRAHCDERLGLVLAGEGLVVSAAGCLAPVDAVLLTAYFVPPVVLLVCRGCLDTTDRPVPKLRGNRWPCELSHPCRERPAHPCGPVPPAGGTGPHS